MSGQPHPIRRYWFASRIRTPVVSGRTGEFSHARIFRFDRLKFRPSSGALIPTRLLPKIRTRDGSLRVRGSRVGFQESHAAKRRSLSVPANFNESKPDFRVGNFYERIRANPTGASLRIRTAVETILPYPKREG